MRNLASFFQTELGLSPEIQSKIFNSVVIAFLFYIVYLIATRLILQRLTDSKTDGNKIYYQWKKILSYVFFFFTCIAIGRIWLAGFQTVTTLIGLVSAGLAIALKDIITNIAGWIFIVSKQPFIVGDRVEIGSHAGDVIDLDVFQFTLMEIAGNRIDAEQSTGRMVHIPNSQIFTEHLANYSKGFDYIWNEIPIVVTFESNRNKVKEALISILDKHTLSIAKEAERSIKSAARKYMLLHSRLNPKVYTDIEDSGVLYTMRYLCRTHNTRDTTEALVEDVLDFFDKNNDIDFAYPTRRVFNNNLEGKAVSKNELQNS